MLNSLVVKAVLEKQIESGEIVQDDINEKLSEKIESEVATDFSEAETPQFQQTIDDVLDSVDELKSDLDKLSHCFVEENIPLINGYVDSKTGEISSLDSYRQTTRIKIPNGVKAIVFYDVFIEPMGTAGWALFSDGSSPSKTVYLRGGQSDRIVNIEENECYYCISTKNISKDYLKVAYIYESYIEFINASNEKNASIPTKLNVYTNYETGAIASISNNQYCGTVRIPIPFGCKKIYFPNVKFSGAGVAGWAVYKVANGGNSTNTFIRGAKTNYIDVKEGEFAFAITNYKADEFTQAEPIDVIYVYNLDVYKINNPFSDKIIGFSGDSITFGYDPSRNGARMTDPWVMKVCRDLRVKDYFNYGVSSASLIDGILADGSRTPMALVKKYVEYSDDIDIFGFMIGINDCFRDYPLGNFNDSTDTTFYGALHILCKGIIEKYKPKDGKKVFMLIYPTYVGKATFPSFTNAMKEVAEYYSIPVLDLSKEMGINIFSDVDCEYWDGIYSSPASRNAHPTQLCAEIIANTVVNYISRMFSH